MSPTVPTTTADSSRDDNDDPSWILRQMMDRRRRPSLPNSCRVALSNLVATPVDQSTRRQQEDFNRQHQDLPGWSSRDLQEGEIADAYDELVTVIGNKGEDAEESGDSWLMSHQSLSSALKGTTMTGSGSVGNGDEQQTIKTVEFWIHQLRSVLHETRSNLGLIVAFHQRQMEQQRQAKQPTTSAVEDPSRNIIRSSKSVAVQTEDWMLKNEEETGDKVAAVNGESKLNYYYRKSVRAASCMRHDHQSHVAGGSLIEQLSPARLHNATTPIASSSGKIFLDSLAGDENACHFIQTSNSCCALSAHSGCFHSGSCCRLDNRQILLKGSTSQQPSYSSRINKTSRKRVIRSSRLDEDEEVDRLQWATRNDAKAILLLNEAWQLAGLHTRQRMSILSRHYRILYKRHRKLRRRHRRLRRNFQRTRRRHLYVQLQLQILLESIGSQVDDVAFEWVDRLKGLLKLQAFTARDPTATDGLMGAPTGFSSSFSPNDSYSPFDFAKSDSGGHQQQQQQQQRQQQQFRANDDHHYSASHFSLYRWYSSLSLKLSWLQTSHRTVIENLLLFQRIPRT